MGSTDSSNPNRDPDSYANGHPYTHTHGYQNAYTHTHAKPNVDPHQHDDKHSNGYVDIDSIDYPDFKSFAKRYGDRYGNAYKFAFANTHGKPVSYWNGYPIGDFKSYADKYLHGYWNTDSDGDPHAYTVPNPIANGNVYASYESTGDPCAWRRLLLHRDLRSPYPEAPVDANGNTGTRPRMDAKGNQEMNPERIKRLEEILKFCELNYGHTAEYVRKLYANLRMAAVLGFKYDTSTDNGLIWIDLRSWAANQYLREMHK